MHLTAVEIIEKMNEHYPLFTQFFKPEVRKIQDIALRERKIQGVGPKEPREPKQRPQKPVDTVALQTKSRFFDTLRY